MPVLGIEPYYSVPLCNTGILLAVELQPYGSKNLDGYRMYPSQYLLRSTATLLSAFIV
jgi:hypothetical protein